MESESIVDPSAPRGFDRTLFIAVLLLVGFGIVMVYSASFVVAAEQMKDAMYFLKRQAIYAVAGVVAVLIGSAIDYRWYKKMVYPFLILSGVAMVLCLTPLGRTINGASRWIGIGAATFQPSELTKLALVLWLSYSLAKKREKIKTFSIGFLPHVIVPGTLIFLCLMQPDFGTAVVISSLTFALLFIAGAKLGYILLALITATPIVYVLVAGSEYRLRRILAFLDPLAEANRFDGGYQLSQSLFGFGKGGVFGVGIGDGLQKLLFLPEAHNDFIAPIIAEELGLVGIWIMLLAFGVVVVRGIMISFRAQEPFGMYTAIGITLLIGVQVLTNLGVAMGLLPTKGLNLPFISYGGSALIMSLFSVGILLSISKYSPDQLGRVPSHLGPGNFRRKTKSAPVGATVKHD